MNGRKPRFRVRAPGLRAALYGTSALIILAGAVLPLGYSPSSVDPFQKAAHAKGGPGGGGPGGGGPGGGGPPDHSNAGGNGNGHGGGISSSGHDGEDGDHDGKNKLGKLNAGNAADAAFRNANPDSTVGQLAIYKQRVLEGLEEEPAGDTITSFQQAIDYLGTFANKLVDDGVVNALNELLGLGEPFEEETAEPEE